MGTEVSSNLQNQISNFKHQKENNKLKKCNNMYSNNSDEPDKVKSLLQKAKESTQTSLSGDKIQVKKRLSLQHIFYNPKIIYDHTDHNANILDLYKFSKRMSSPRCLNFSNLNSLLQTEGNSEKLSDKASVSETINIPLPNDLKSVDGKGFSLDTDNDFEFEDDISTIESYFRRKTISTRKSQEK